MNSLAEIPLAIVGLSCRLPGAADTAAYWDLLANGRVAWSEMPPERFDRELFFDPEPGKPTKSYTTLGSLVPPQEFDARGCPLPAELIERSHPVHLALAEVTADAFRSAGYDPFDLPQQKAGVYVGHTAPSGLLSDVVTARLIEGVAPWLNEVDGIHTATGNRTPAVIQELIQTIRRPYEQGTPDGKFDPRLTMRGNAHHAAAVLTQGFRLNGPSMAFDAACASSLRALAHGARALQLGEIDMAVVSGASFLHSDTLVLFSQARSLSKFGSRPFDDDADGLVAAEGFVTVIVKTLDKALDDGNDVWAVIRGIGMSSDGKGKSLWAPRKEGQIEAIRRAYPAGMSPASLDYLEMHATSTQLGDATEVDAFRTVLADDPPPRQIPIGSVKANIGHSLEVAGLASIAKTVLALRHKTIPPQINVNTPSSKIAWSEVPFRLPLQAEALQPTPGRSIRAAVNAFGIGGLNVHVVLEGFDTTHHTRSERPRNHRPTEADEPIAIIGAGAVLPGANDIDAARRMLLTSESHISDVPAGRWPSDIGFDDNTANADNPLWRVPCQKGGFITDFVYDWKKNKVPPKHVAHADPLQFMLLDSADQAMHDAGLAGKDTPPDTTRTGVIVGSIFAGEFANELAIGLRLQVIERQLATILQRLGTSAVDITRINAEFEKLVLSRLSALIDETGSFTASTQSSRISKTFNLMGGAVALDSGDASGSAALSTSIDLLRAGDCDVMLCAAGHRALDKATYEYMFRAGRLSQCGNAVPFGENSDGCVPGEGAVTLVLKRLADAQRDGDRVHGVIGRVTASRHDDLTESVAEATARAITENSEVNFLTATATGVAAEDAAIVGGLAKAMSHDGRGRPVTGLAPQLGHTGGLSGIVELLRAMCVANAGDLPQGVVDGEALPALRSSGLSLPRKSTRLQPGIATAPLTAGIVSFNEPGVAYHVQLQGTATFPDRVVVPKSPEHVDPVNVAALPTKPSRSIPANGEFTTAFVCRAASERHSSAVGIDDLCSESPAVAALCAELNAVIGDRPPSPALDALRRNVLQFALFREMQGEPFAVVSDAANLWAALAISGSCSLTTAVQQLIQPGAEVALSPPRLPVLFVGTQANRFLADPAELLAAAREPSASADNWQQAFRRLANDGVTQFVDVNGSEPQATVTNSSSQEWIELKGTPEQIGFQHGQRFADVIREQLQTSPAVGQLLGTSAVMEAELPADLAEELRGIARGADVDYESLLAFNIALSQTSDTLTHGAMTPPETLQIVSQELQGTAFERPLTPFLQYRQPNENHAIAGLAIAGQAGLLAGVNASGLCVSGATLSSKDTPNSLAAEVVSRLLTTCDDVDSAHAAIKSTSDLPAMSLVLLDPVSGVRYCEHDGVRTATVHQADAIFAGSQPLLTPRQRASTDCIAAHADRLQALSTTQIEDAIVWQVLPAASGVRVAVRLPHSPEAVDVPLPFAMSSKQSAGQPDVPTPTANTGDERLPLVDAVIARTATCLVTQSLMDPVADAFLDQHRFKQRPLLPAVVALEAVVETAMLAAGNRVPNDQPVMLRNIELLTGMRFHTDDPRPLRVIAEQRESGWQVTAVADVVNRKQQVLKPHEPALRADVVTAGETPVLTLVPVLCNGDEIRPEASACGSQDTEPGVHACGSQFPIWYYEDGLALYHGPVFRTLQTLWIDGDHVGGQLIANDVTSLAPQRSTGGWRLPAALLDGCFFACGSYTWLHFEETVAIPAGIDSLTVFRVPAAGERCALSLKYRAREGQQFVFDFTLRDNEGRTILHATGYRSVIVVEPTRSEPQTVFEQAKR